MENQNIKTIAKLLPSGDSLVLANLSNIHNSSKTCIITNDATTAMRLCDEIRLFAATKKVALFPDYGILPYERSSIPSEVTAKRFQTIWQILHTQIDILIVDANTLLTPLPPTSYITSRMFVVKVGDNLSLNNLKSQLIAGNYSPTSQVYEAGEFATRGSVVDIMPMGGKHLIRLDFFDNEIESIKLLDVKTHEVLDTILQYELIPVAEYPKDQNSIKNFNLKFGKYFNQYNDSDHKSELQKGLLPPGCEFYLPLFFDEDTTSLLDYVTKPQWQIIYNDNLNDVLIHHFQDITRRYQIYSYQFPCIKPEDLFITPKTIQAAIHSYTTNYIIINNNKTHQELESLPNLAVENHNHKNFTHLSAFQQNFNGKIIIVSDSLGRLEILRNQLNEYGLKTIIINDLNQANTINIIYLLKHPLYNGFISHHNKPSIAFITEQDLLPHLQKREKRQQQTKAIANDALVNDLAELKPGDFVVHINHGIAKYLGLTTQEIDGSTYEMLELEYLDDARMYIPIYNLHYISHYSKIDDTAPKLNKLGSSQWAKIKKKCERQVEDIAAKLLDLYAKRELQTGTQLTIPKEYVEFANSFGYEPTVDQASCFEAVIHDLTQKKSMDRLICGDVGFGKTEVAMRAAFIVAMNGMQVAILTPTTLLTEQHFQNFSNRFAQYPIKIAEVSRFKSRSEIKATLEQVQNGQVDIIIGTHRLIQNDIKFKNLGLVIVDEEHRFGVKQKEHLKKLRTNVDFLALTATPIPRSMSMALDGLRDFSIIATPPKKRLAVNSQMVLDDKEIIREAIMRESRRGGQIFFLYNDVATITQMYDRLVQIAPEINIAIAHGQMPEQNLDRTIRDFVLQKYHLLLCSTIIESGIDIPNANTIIIYNSHKLGLAALYQLRGRVGRSYQQAYCYLVRPETLSNDAEKRLDAILATSELGAGFNLALHDLEIRGAGEILGDSQSGNIKDVGLSLYTSMLKKAIKNLKKQQGLNIEDTTIDNNLDCEVNLNTPCIIPKEYCYDIHKRLIYYKRLAKANNLDEIDQVYQEIIDSCGLPPDTVKNLITQHQIRLSAISVDIIKITTTNTKITLTFAAKPKISPDILINLMQQLKTCKLDTNQNKFIYDIEMPDNNAKIQQTQKLLTLFHPNKN